MDERQKNQYELAFTNGAEGEAPHPSGEGTEATTAGPGTESQADTSALMEEVCERENLKEALRRVQANAGAAGIDGMSVVSSGSAAGCDAGN